MQVIRQIQLSVQPGQTKMTLAKTNADQEGMLKAVATISLIFE